MSVLTDQVEAQGEKIRDLEICLEGHQLKLNATEEMLQQVKIWVGELLAEYPPAEVKIHGPLVCTCECPWQQDKMGGKASLVVLLLLCTFFPRCFFVFLLQKHFTGWLHNTVCGSV